MSLNSLYEPRFTSGWAAKATGLLCTSHSVSLGSGRKFKLHTRKIIFVMWCDFWRPSPCIIFTQQFWGRNPASADHSWDFVYRCKSNQSWFFLPRLQFYRELCHLSLKVFSHANSLIRLYTLPNFFNFKQRISQKGKTCSRIWNPQHFSLSEEVTLHVRIRLQAGKTMTVLFFRKCLWKAFMRAWMCSFKQHKYEFFFMETTNNDIGNYNWLFFPKWQQFRTGLDLDGGWVLRSNLKEIKKRKKRWTNQLEPVVETQQLFKRVKKKKKVLRVSTLAPCAGRVCETARPVYCDAAVTTLDSLKGQLFYFKNTGSI